MKKSWFLILLTTAIAAGCQPAVKIFAYSQQTTPGIIPKGVTGENGNPAGIKKEAAVNYFFYATYKPGIVINFSEVWIGKEYYQVLTEAVSSTPVVMINKDIPAQPVKEELVPATKQQVVSITPIGSPGNKTIDSTWFRKMQSKSALIVSYLYKGKKHFIPVKNIKPLLPAAGM